MNEITRIHLASIPFNVEIEAKKSLEKYLAGVEKSLAADKDTLREIEARIVEIVNERGVVEEKVITSEDVQAIVEQLGQPEAFVDEEAIDAERLTAKAPKRLYRDIDNGMLAGVCSGIAAFFKADVTLVRLLSVLLIPLTAGAIIPLYIVLAVITPAAKTGAQKLQMAGEPVTLASLKEQATSVSSDKSRQMILRILTIMLGIGFTMAAIAALVGLGFAAITGIDYLLNKDWTIVLMAVAFGLAGVMFVTMMAVLAYASFTMKFTKKIGISLVVIVVIGLLLAISGGLGIGYQSNKDYAENYVERSLDVSGLKNINRLVLDSASPVHVEYVATGNNTSRRASYNYMKNHLPSQRTFDVKLLVNDNVLTVDIASYADACKRQHGECGQVITIKITGPVLETIELSNGNSINYQVEGGQPNLLTAQEGATSNITIESDRPIVSLTALIGGGAVLSASQANIVDATITVSDNRSGMNLARLKTLNLNVPESCAQAEDQTSLNVLGARMITVNGTAYQEDAEYPCALVSIGDNDGWDN